MFAALVFFLVLSAGVFSGAVLAWIMQPHEARPFPQFSGLLMPRPDGAAGADDAEAADGCVPMLVTNDTRSADVLASMVDKSLDTRGKVAITDRTFEFEASAAVSNLTMTFNPPVTVPGGSSVTVPMPAAPSALVRPSGRIVCEVRQDGVCRPSVETPSYSIWHLNNGPASIAARAEHQNTSPDEVRVDFQVKGAIDGGTVAGAGLHLAPPQGFVQYANAAKTVSPYIGSARWKCVWSL